MIRRVGTKKRRAIVDALIERDGTDCTWCCQPMVDLPVHPKLDCSAHMTLEHLMPLILGGTYEPRNLALACLGCNSARGADLEWSHEDSDVLASVCVL